MSILLWMRRAPPHLLISSGVEIAAVHGPLGVPCTSATNMGAYLYTDNWKTASEKWQIGLEAVARGH